MARKETAMATRSQVGRGDERRVDGRVDERVADSGACDWRVVKAAAMLPTQSGKQDVGCGAERANEASGRSSDDYKRVGNGHKNGAKKETARRRYVDTGIRARVNRITTDHTNHCAIPTGDQSLLWMENETAETVAQLRWWTVVSCCVSARR